MSSAHLPPPGRVRMPPRPVAVVPVPLPPLVLPPRQPRDFRAEWRRGAPARARVTRLATMRMRREAEGLAPLGVTSMEYTCG